MKIRDKVLPVLRPLADQTDIDELADTLKSGWWGRGPKVDKLEKDFAKRIGSKYAVAVTSNTVGLDLALKALNIKEGNIISPTISFVTTAAVPLWNNCESRLCDINEKDRNISPSDVKNYVDENTNGIISVNYAGINSDIESLRRFYKGPIIEDCAWSCYTKNAGLRGDIAVWSFQAVKTISSGDGGIVTTNSEKVYQKLKLLTNFGIPEDTYKRAMNDNKTSLKPGYVWDFEISSLGYKSYMNDLQASLVLSQLRHLDKYLEIRMKIQKKYNEELPEEMKRPEWSNTCGLYSPSVSAKFRNDLMNYLSTKNIHTTIHFKPLHLHPLFAQKRKFLVADREWHKFISLPCHPNMSEEDIDYVIYWVKEFFKKK